MKLGIHLLILVIVSFMSLSIVEAYPSLTKKQFIADAFSENTTTEIKTLWLNDELQSKIKPILDHRYPKLRLKYWFSKKQNQSVWFLDEIGKERPISFAINIVNKKVKSIRVLKFRENRGGEITMLSFANQFNNITLNNDLELDNNIDGITGATLSVTAMKKVTRLALLLHGIVINEKSE